MENSRVVRTIKFTFIFGGILTISPLFSFAYEPETTHRALTQEIIKTFNHHVENKISSIETNEIIQGSVNEDSPTIRAMHHFYDPVSNRGLTIAGKEWMSSKEWAQNTKAQAGILDSAFAGTVKSLFSGEDDYSWDRAIYEYAWRDQKRGSETLGHIIHLIEDMAVPDHTRNDDHLPYFNAILQQQSPYEHWADRWNIGNIQTAEEIAKDFKKPVSCSTLGYCFDSIALYSNNNFFSKDTILKDYDYPNIQEERSELLSDGQFYTFGYSKDNFGNSIRSVKIKRATRWSEPEYSLLDNDYLILQTYWSLLSKQAVLHGAGVVKLFFDEVEKERQTKELYNRNRSWVSKQVDKARGFASALLNLNTTTEVSPTIGGETSTNQGLASVSEANPSVATKVSPPATVAPRGLASDDKEAKPLPQPPLPQPPTQPPASPISSFPAGAGGGVADKTPPPKPMIFSPAADNQVFTVTTATFRGRAEKNSTVTNSLNNQTTATDSSEDYGFWTLALNSLPQGTSTIEFLSTDASGNVSEGISRTIFVDSMGPSSSLTVSECNQSLSTEGCLTTGTELTLEWSSSATDFSHYIVSCETGGSACSSFSVNSTATTTTYAVPESNTTYTFKVKAVDIYGNKGMEQSKEVEIIDRPVVINEIAWAGTSAAQDQDEWIELYNPTSKTIDISQFKLKSQTDNKPNINLSGSIPAKGYYLIERTDDTTISDITASTTASFGNGSGAGLVNTGEVLAIEYKGANIDETPAISACSGWCGGQANPNYYTMERYDPSSSGTSTTNWGTWSGFLNNGANADGVAIKGTPGKRNSINYLITKDGGPLNQDKTLTKANSPYVIQSATFTIGSTAATTLTIEPGVVIKFMNDASMTVHSGKVLAQGTAADKIVFTSFKDDEYGGDTDAVSATSLAGDWRGVVVKDSGSILGQTIFRYGGALASGYQANLRVENASTTIANSVFEHSKNYGVWLLGATTTVSGNTFRNNSTTTSSIGLLVTDGAVTIQNNTFGNNTYGLRTTSNGAAHSIAVSNNIFTGNTLEAIDVVSGFPTFSGNSISNSGTNGILWQSVISQNHTLAANLPYKISTGWSVSASTTLTLDAGVILKFTNSGSLTVQGNLVANGTSANKVTFTSIKDDSYGGDTNNDGSTTSAAKADWSQVHIENATATSTLTHAVFSYGTTALKLTNSIATLDNILFKTNTTGIKSIGTSTTTATNITFEGNTTDDDPTSLIP